MQAYSSTGNNSNKQSMLPDVNFQNKLKVHIILFRHTGSRIQETIFSIGLKPAIGRPCVLALVHSDTVPAFTCDCLRVDGVFMWRRYFDLCV